MFYENLKPPEITYRPVTGQQITFPPNGLVARVMEEVEPVAGYELATVRRKLTGIAGLPDPDGETIYIVSNIVFERVPESRKDVIAPDTGIDSVQRDSKGHIVAVSRFNVK